MSEIPDGPPVDMSKVTLGPRYSSEDMYRDYPDLKLGDRVSVERGGVVYTDQIQSVTYGSAGPLVWPKLTRRQRIARYFTPKRWRKPLQPIHQPATMTVNVGDQVDAVARAGKSIAEIEQLLSGFSRNQKDT